MNNRNKRQSLKLEKTQAVERRRVTRRIKQFFVLALISLPLILYLSGVLTNAGVNDAWSIVIFCAIFIVLWCLMILADNLVLKQAKKIRQIKNAQAIVDKYNAEVLKRREESAASKQDEVKEETAENIVEAEPQTEVTQEIEPENKNETQDKNILQNEQKNVMINNEEKKNKLKQKKYGSFNNKRKK